MRAFELLHDPVRWYAAKLRVNWAETRLFSHVNYFTSASNHGTGRQSKLRNERPDVCTEHGTKIVNQRFSGGGFTPGRMKDQIQTYVVVQLMHYGHESVFVRVVYLYILPSFASVTNLNSR